MASLFAKLLGRNKEKDVANDEKEIQVGETTIRFKLAGKSENCFWTNQKANNDRHEWFLNQDPACLKKLSTALLDIIFVAEAKASCATRTAKAELDEARKVKRQIKSMKALTDLRTAIGDMEVDEQGTHEVNNEVKEDVSKKRKAAVDLKNQGKRLKKGLPERQYNSVPTPVPKEESGYTIRSVPGPVHLPPPPYPTAYGNYYSAPYPQRPPPKYEQPKH